MITGNPDPKHISTSYAERKQPHTADGNAPVYPAHQRLLQEKLANHEAAIALHFMHYNFVRIHHMLRVTPAMAAGVTDRLWSIEDIASLLGAMPAEEVGRNDARVQSDGGGADRLGRTGGRADRRPRHV